MVYRSVPVGAAWSTAWFAGLYLLVQHGLQESTCWCSRVCRSVTVGAASSAGEYLLVQQGLQECTCWCSMVCRSLQECTCWCSMVSRTNLHQPVGAAWSAAGVQCGVSGYRRSGSRVWSNEYCRQCSPSSGRCWSGSRFQLRSQAATEDIDTAVQFNNNKIICLDLLPPPRRGSGQVR